MDISAVGIYPRNVTVDYFDPSGNRGFNEEASGLNYVVAAAAQKYKVVIPSYDSGIGIDGLVQKIMKEDPNVLLLGLETVMLPNAKEIIRRIKEQKANKPIPLL